MLVGNPGSQNTGRRLSEMGVLLFTLRKKKPFLNYTAKPYGEVAKRKSHATAQRRNAKSNALSLVIDRATLTASMNRAK